MKRYIIVGGVAAGATAAARLRRLDEQAEIILIERGPNVSYANCGLPYYIGGEIAQRKTLFVATKESIESKYNVQVWENCEVTAIDPEAHTAEVLNKKTGQSTTESYTQLLLSTGSSPVVPPFPGVDSSRVFTLWTVPDTDRIKNFIDTEKPKRAVVVGGGFIGLEMVENLVHLGIAVDLVEMMPQVMAPFDPDMSKIIENHLAEQGVRLHLGKGLVSIHDDGRRLLLNDDSEIHCDMVLLSIGVRPNNDLAKQLGLDMAQRGHVVTDDNMRTSVKDIYAAGDLIESTDFLTGDRKCVPLAGPANKQGRIAADTMVADAHADEADGFKLGPSARYDGTQGTSIARIFDLSCGSTGLNEKALKAKGLEFGKDYSYSLLHPQSHAGYFPGALPMTIKLLFSLEDGKVYGTQIIGYDGVDKRVDVIATAIRFKANIYDLTRLELAYAPPYSSAKDPVNFAGYAATNIYENITHPVTWEQAFEETKEEGKDLLDIREHTERLASIIEGIQHIPLTEIRGRMDELDKSKTYYVFCSVGLRGYIAERILKQEGFDCRNILGGIRTWKALYDTDTSVSLEDQSDLPQDSDRSAPTLESVPAAGTVKLESLNVCGLSCPGPIVEVAKTIETLEPGTHLYVTATDPGFTKDIQAWCENTGNRLVKKGREGKEWFAEIQKGGGDPAADDTTPQTAQSAPRANEKTMIVFSGDLDKAIASFIIANGAAAMGNKVNMFFTFWGLNILRRDQKVPVKKDFMSKMFSGMMPRGSRKLGLSKMNFGGAGKNMIRNVMKKKNIASLEELIQQAKEAGVKMTACQMSMDVMGITHEELIDGVEVGGVASMLNDNDRSNMNLFI